MTHSTFVKLHQTQQAIRSQVRSPDLESADLDWQVFVNFFHRVDAIWPIHQSALKQLCQECAHETRIVEGIPEGSEELANFEI